MKTFEILEAGKTYVTRDGRTVKAICLTNGKMYCRVYSHITTTNDFSAKYKLNGSRWGASVESPEDIVALVA